VPCWIFSCGLCISLPGSKHIHTGLGEAIGHVCIELCAGLVKSGCAT